MLSDRLALRFPFGLVLCCSHRQYERDKFKSRKNGTTIHCARDLARNDFIDGYDAALPYLWSTVSVRTMLLEYPALIPERTQMPVV